MIISKKQISDIRMQPLPFIVALNVSAGIMRHELRSGCQRYLSSTRHLRLSDSKDGVTLSIVTPKAHTATIIYLSLKINIQSQFMTIPRTPKIEYDAI